MKIFSINKFTRSTYRYLGNVFGQKKRRQQSIDVYVNRDDQLIQLIRKYDVLKDGGAAVELGAGWIHWFGLYLVLNSRSDVSLELCDVWDNRQLDTLKSTFSKLASQLESDSSKDDAVHRAQLAFI